MTISYQLFALFCVGFLLAGMAVIFYAFFKQKWLLAIVTFVCLLGVFGAVTAYIAHTDSYLKATPTTDKLAGTYAILDPATKEHLTEMGYKDLSGKILLDPKGTFNASQIPACCLQQDPSDKSHPPVAYYHLAGTWKLEQSYAIYVLHLTLSTEEISSPDHSTAAPTSQTEPTPPPKELEIHLINSTPLSLGLAVFNGEFENLVFTKE